ncbi:MAG: hypothetical protein UT58_C0008G0014, partial [Microgenomates group bacterium GW2011_GWC1_39_7b]
TQTLSDLSKTAIKKPKGQNKQDMEKVLDYRTAELARQRQVQLKQVQLTSLPSTPTEIPATKA